MDKENKVRVGMAAIIIREKEVLLGKRKGSHGSGTWAFPGGHLEFKETYEMCLLRELKEEIDFNINNIYFIDPYPSAATNDFFQAENKHYITLFSRLGYIKGEPYLKEPDKCKKWEWFNWDSLPYPRFLAIENLLKQGYNPFQ